MCGYFQIHVDQLMLAILHCPNLTHLTLGMNTPVSDTVLTRLVENNALRKLTNLHITRSEA